MITGRLPVTPLTRRKLLQGLAAAGGIAATAPAFSQSTALGGIAAGLTPGSDADQSAAFQAAIDIAAERGVPLFLPGGSYRVSGITLPAGLKLIGSGDATVLRPAAAGPIFSAQGAEDLSLTSFAVDGARGDNDTGDLIHLVDCANATISELSLKNGSENGVWLERCNGFVRDCRFSGFRLTALHVQDGTGVLISGNTVAHCGNGGVRVWRYETGRDGAIITGNRISGILSDTGNGQNGNGVNVFNAGDVIVADNIISDCDFSAVRLNATRNAAVRGNICTDCREVAIFSEFGFSGSVISDNIIDRAALGISITNLDSGGYLATCSGNLVRNIQSSSPTNPDTRPVGIFAEADTAITGNVVETVPGIGILAGWGPYLRNVLVSGNVVRDTDTGIGVSVADGAGRARITDNLISNALFAAISGFAWEERVGADLADSPDQFETIDVEGNSVD